LAEETAPKSSLLIHICSLETRGFQCASGLEKDAAKCGAPPEILIKNRKSSKNRP
jgi:hypothetical protein